MAATPPPPSDSIIIIIIIIIIILIAMTPAASPDSITIPRPDDWHIHLRDGALLQTVAPLAAAQFGRAIVMPNLTPPVTTAAAATAYRERILAALPPSAAGEANTPVFCPLMTLYLTPTTSVEDIAEAAATPHIVACKLYPAGATTNSASGVRSIDGLWPVFGAMAAADLVLCVHGECADPDVDVFERESAFVRDDLPRLVAAFPTLRVVLEHVSTRDGVAAVMGQARGGRLAATVTAHHLLYSRAALFRGGRLRPHLFCAPVLKAEVHRASLVEAVMDDTSGRFFLGSDSAPHVRSSKLGEGGAAAGVYSGRDTLALYAEVFEAAGGEEWVAKFRRFASVNGAAFYGLPPPVGTVTLVRGDYPVPAFVEVVGGNGPTDDSSVVVPLRAGEVVHWRVETQES
ncbi:hypothetical protein MMPV_008929 [Pyropia vietnamensis]